MKTSSLQIEPGGRGERQYLPALDGIRALALLAVLAYHASPSLFPGGFIGVEVFFVVSGFIITRALVAERSASGRISLARFWKRRARRLLPALLLLLAGLMSYAVVLEPDRVARLRQDALPALSYVSNWYLVFDHQSYFDSFAPPSPLRHLWSLAVEEQFYIVWPVLFLVASRWLSRNSLLIAVLALAAISSLAMVLLYESGADVSRLYYGTDTRASGFLVGAGLALMMTRTPFAGRMSRCTSGAAVVAVFTLAVLALTLPSDGRITYEGGLLLVALLTATVIYAAMVGQQTPISRALALAPMRWLGVRSYGVYLWHWPLVVLASPETSLPFGGLTLAGVQIGLAVGLAALSYTLVEQPIRHGALGRMFPARRSLSRYALTAGGSVALVFVGVSACTMTAEVPEYMRRESVRGFVTPISDATAASREAIAPTPAIPQSDPSTAPDRTSCEDVRGTSYRSESERSWFLLTCLTPVALPADAGSEAQGIGSSSARTGSPSVQPAPPGAPPTAVAATTGTFVTAVGDSVMLGAADALAAALGSVYVDAAVSRQASAGVSVLQALASRGQLSAVVVVHLGNNGTFSESEVHQIMAIAGQDRRVVFVTLKVDRPWEGGNNNAIRNASSGYPNARIADWKAISGGRAELFWDDGIHLRPEGAVLYAQLIASTSG